MTTFFRGITESIPSLFRGIFSERNSVANPSPNSCQTVSIFLTPISPHFLLPFGQFLNQGKEIRILDQRLTNSERIPGLDRRRIRLMCGRQCKFSSLKSDLDRDFAAAVYLFKAPSPRSFSSWGGLAISRFWICSDTECKSPAVYALTRVREEGVC
jgi:hypothetical protein